MAATNGRTRPCAPQKEKVITTHDLAALRAECDSLLPLLKIYEQADEEGVMVLASRQAIDESAALLTKQQAAIDELERQIEESREQEPVAQVVGDLDALPFKKVAWLGKDLETGTQLYAAPVVSPPAVSGPEGWTPRELRLLDLAAHRLMACAYQEHSARSQKSHPHPETAKNFWEDARDLERLVGKLRAMLEIVPAAVPITEKRDGTDALPE